MKDLDLNAYSFKAIFLLLPFLYALLFAPYGFGSHDTGYILGLSWQFFNGSIPYSEIIYVTTNNNFKYNFITI